MRSYVLGGFRSDGRPVECTDRDPPFALDGAPTAWGVKVLDTVVRLLEPIDDKAIEPLRPMIRTLRYGAPGRAGPMRPVVPQDRIERSQVGERALAAGRIEVRDAVLWVKHIRHDNPLWTRLAELSEGTRIELDIDGFRGTWEKMRDGRDGRPTPGLKPQGSARAHWRVLYEKKRGIEVTIAPIEAGTG